MPAKASPAKTIAKSTNRPAKAAGSPLGHEESLKSEGAQAKRKTTVAEKKVVPKASAAGEGAKAKVAAKVISSSDNKLTAPTKGVGKPVSDKLTSIKSSTADAPVAGDVTTNSSARDAETRDNKAKGIVAKENSVKSAPTKLVVNETSTATGEGRSAIKSVSGVKTSAAAFFAARQKMAPVKAPVRVVGAKVAEKSADAIEVKPTDAAASVATVSNTTTPGTTPPLGKMPEAGLSDGAKAPPWLMLRDVATTL